MTEPQPSVSRNARGGGPPVVCGLGLIVLDQQVFLREYPTADSKVSAQRHRTQLGGPVPTALAQLQRFGVGCRMLGSWADDAAGREIEGDLKRTGIGFDAAACRTASGSGFAHVWVESATGRRTVVSSPPKGEPDVVAAAEFGRAARVLHLDGWGGEAAVAAAEATRDNGGLVVLDCGSAKPATERLLPLANVLNVPRRFVRSYCGTDDWEAGARSLAERGPRLVTVTDGEHGAGVYGGGTAVWLPTFRVRAVDTCGAGDVFCGGLIYAVLIGLGPVEALRFAMATAALKVSRSGNREALAGREEVQRLLESQE